MKNNQKNKRKSATIDSALVDDDEQENFLESLTDPKMRSTIVPLHVEITRYKSLVIEAIAYKRLDDKDDMDLEIPWYFGPNTFNQDLYFFELFEDYCLNALVQRI